MNRNTKEPLISIVIPVYNADKYLDHCWKSLKEQTYHNLEYIFVDDCSSDNSIEKLKSIRDSDVRVKVFQTERNSGVSAARNLGIDHSSGGYIGFCDADDICDNHMFESMVSAIESSGADIACCSLIRKKPDNTVVSVLWEAPKGMEMTPEEALRAWLVGKYIGNSVYTKVFKKNLWDGIRFPDGETFEEAAVIPLLFIRAKKIVHTGEIGYIYYQREGSINTLPFSEKKLIVYKRENDVRHYITEHFPNLKDAVDIFIVRQNIALMIGIELTNRDKKSELYKKVRKEFVNIMPAGLQSKELSIKKKLQIIELYLGLFHLRKRMLIKD